MTRAQEILRKQMLAKIHANSNYKTIKNALAWEEWLSARFSVDSCKGLSIDELKQVLRFLQNRAQWDGEPLIPDIVGRHVVNSKNISPKQKMQIASLKKSLSWSEERLNEFVRHQTGVSISGGEAFLAKLSKKQASTVITGLKKVVLSPKRKGEK
ncbi:MAG: DUF1018 domain-containing protein [Campylobacter sp.]|nr:DUF1018 domain-containing protein [Campylobacter sp.]